VANVRNITQGLNYAAGAADLQTAITAANDGDVIEIQSSIVFDPIVFADKNQLLIRVEQGAGLSPTIFLSGSPYGVWFQSSYTPPVAVPPPYGVEVRATGNTVNGFDGTTRALTIKSDSGFRAAVVVEEISAFGNAVIGCNIQNTHATGTCVLGVNAGANNWIRYCTLEGVAGSSTGYDPDGYGLSMHGCQIFNHAYGMIFPTVVHSTLIYNCTTAVWKATSATSLRGCTLDGGVTGIQGNAASDEPKVYNTVISNFTTAAIASCLVSSFYNTRYYQNGGGTLNLYTNLECAEDPYLDRAGQDFSPNSNGGDTGIYNTGQDQSAYYTDDIYQTTRPQHGAWDIGAIELVTLQPVPRDDRVGISCDTNTPREQLVPLMQDVEAKMVAASQAADDVVAVYDQLDEQLAEWPNLEDQIEDSASSCWPASDSCADVLQELYQVVQYDGRAYHIAGTNLTTLRLFHQLYGMEDLNKFMTKPEGYMQVAIYRERVNAKDCPEAPDSYTRTLLATNADVNAIRAQNQTVPDAEFKVMVFFANTTKAFNDNSAKLYKYGLSDGKSQIFLGRSYTPDSGDYSVNVTILSFEDFSEVSFYLDNNQAFSHFLDNTNVEGIDTDMTDTEVLQYLKELAEGSSAPDESYTSLGGVASTVDILYCTNIAVMSLGDIDEKLAACGAEIPLLDVSAGIKEALNAILDFLGGFTTYLETMQDFTTQVTAAARKFEGVEKKILQALGLGDINTSILQCIFKQGVHLGLPKIVADSIIPTLPTLTLTMNILVDTIDTFLAELEKPICVMTSFTDLFVGRNMGLLKCFNLSFSFDMPPCLIEILELMRTALGAFSSITFGTFYRIQFALGLAATLMSGIDIEFEGSSGCYNETLATFQKALGESLSGLDLGT